jgi:hypothetical protein
MVFASRRPRGIHKDLHGLHIGSRLRAIDAARACYHLPPFCRKPVAADGGSIANAEVAGEGRLRPRRVNAEPGMRFFAIPLHASFARAPGYCPRERSEVSGAGRFRPNGAVDDSARRQNVDSSRGKESSQ